MADSAESTMRLSRATMLRIHHSRTGPRPALMAPAPNRRTIGA